MYISYVRPVVEYASQAWLPYFVVALSCTLESVQQKFTKRQRGAFGMAYKQVLAYTADPPTESVLS